MLPIRPTRRTLTVAAYLAIVALALMMWPLVDERPFAVVVALSVGQGLGTLSFLLFLGVVATDLFKKRVLSDSPDDASFNTTPPPPRSEKKRPSDDAKKRANDEGATKTKPTRGDGGKDPEIG